MKTKFLILLFLIPLNCFALINGSELVGKPDVVRLIFKNNSHVCSGVFIDEYTILTAAHCITRSWKEQSLDLDQILSVSDENISVKQIKNISHPDFKDGWWPAHDVGLIKTTKNPKFRGEFSLEQKLNQINGSAFLYGSGVVDLEPKKLGRSFGQNNFFRIGSVFFFFGEYKNSETTKGKGTSIAPNDSGGPFVGDSTGTIFGVLTQTWLKKAAAYKILNLNVATSILSESNLNFILHNMGQIPQE